MLIIGQKGSLCWHRYGNREIKKKGFLKIGYGTTCEEHPDSHITLKTLRFHF